MERVFGYLKSGLDAGAEATAGGAAIEGPGYFVQPTVLQNANRDMAVVREEIFGPVITANPPLFHDHHLLDPILACRRLRWRRPFQAN